MLPGFQVRGSPSTLGVLLPAGLECDVNR
jgi:hypothetical protein